MTMGVASDLGDSVVASIDPRTGYPMDQWGHLLRTCSMWDGTPIPHWDAEGTTLPNLTSPYGFMLFAAGSGDDFVCFDHADLNAGPRGEFHVLHATLNSETGHFIDRFEYEVLPANSAAERILVVRTAIGMVDRALEWVYENDLKHDRRGWNQDPMYFAVNVARSLFDWRFRPGRRTPAGRKARPLTDKEHRFYGPRVRAILNDILQEKA